MPPARPIPTRVVVFVDAQNLYYRCREHFGWSWAHPFRLAEALVEEDRQRYGARSHVLSGVRYYTGIHDSNRRPAEHRRMERRLDAYKQDGVLVRAIPLRYDATGRAREKGVDVRIAIDLTRLGVKGLFDVAIVVSEDSDLDEAVQDVYELRDDERWIAVENALPWSPNSHTRWLPSARRRRRIDSSMFSGIRDDTAY
jgi:uncharacterized LabA/DUF88 family protein